MNEAQEKTVIALLPVSFRVYHLTLLITPGLSHRLNYQLVHPLQYLQDSLSKACLRIPLCQSSPCRCSSFHIFSCFLLSNGPIVCFYHFHTSYQLLSSDQSYLKSHSHHCGFFLYFCYEVSVCTHLVMSLNRCFATWTPYHYQKVFSDDMTKIGVVCVWIYTGTVSVLFFQSKFTSLL